MCVCCDATMASWGVAFEPVAVEEARMDVVAVATCAERRGVGARLGGMVPFVDAFKGGFLAGERGIMLEGQAAYIR